MASNLLLPPLIDSSIPSFVTKDGGGTLTIYFLINNTLNVDINSLRVRVKIYRQDGISVFKNNKNCLNDIIYNQLIKYDSAKEKYYITVDSNTLKSVYEFNDGNKFSGWIPGWTYKIQIGLCPIWNTTTSLDEWIRLNSAKFSDWSTICYFKPIAPMILKIPVLNYDSSIEKTNNSKTIYTIGDTTFEGSLKNKYVESREEYKFIKLSLYDEENNLLEESKDIYNVSQSLGYFNYQFKIDFEKGKKYRLNFYYETDNGYISMKDFDFRVMNFRVEPPDSIFIYTVDSAGIGDISMTNTSLADEEEEGRIALKIVSTEHTPIFKNLCIRRSSEKDNYRVWEDIKILNVVNKDPNDLDLFYDYTIESGIKYKYGIQYIDKKGRRSEMNVMTEGVKRIFEHSYLLGDNGVQLKLPFNTTLTSYKHQIYDSKTDSIGGRYPVITRNASVNYRTFTLNTLISCQMDTDNIFMQNPIDKDTTNFYFNNKQIDSKVYKTYEGHQDNDGFADFDKYTYERVFREKVMDFLQDGKPKLFKSFAEGNIIVRLMDISGTPDKTLSRKLYSLSMQVIEIADNTLENYLKYGFYNPGFYATIFEEDQYQLGQLSGTFKIRESSEDDDDTNILKKIYEKYDSQQENLAGYVKRLIQVERVKITINGYYYNVGDEIIYVPKYNMKIVPHDIELDNDELYYLGSELYVENDYINKNYITILNSEGIYHFDDSIKFYYDKKIKNKLCFCGDAEGRVTAVDASIDFIYKISIQNYEEPEEKQFITEYKIGQISDTLIPQTSIYNLIYTKYYFKTDLSIRYLDNLDSIEIEADPHTVFSILDNTDPLENGGEYHEVNDTGLLVLNNIGFINDIIYVGRLSKISDYDEGQIGEELTTVIEGKTVDIDPNSADNKHYIVYNKNADVTVRYKGTVINKVYEPEE